MTTDAKTAVLDWTDALNRGDAEAAASWFTEDGIWRDVGFGMVCEGRAAMVAAWSTGVFTELHIVKTTFIVAGDAFANEWTMSGRHIGPAPGVPPTGRTFRVTGAGVGRDAQREDRAGRRVLEHGGLPGPGRAAVLNVTGAGRLHRAGRRRARPRSS